jgi:tetratricopeptide (TPR) repeat protein
VRDILWITIYKTPITRNLSGFQLLTSPISATFRSLNNLTTGLLPVGETAISNAPSKTTSMLCVSIRESAVLYNNRRVVYFEQNEFDRAIADFKKALRIDPDLSRAYRLISRL